MTLWDSLPYADKALVLVANTPKLPKLKQQLKASPNQGNSASAGGAPCHPSRNVAVKIDHKFRYIIYGLTFTEKINFCVQLLPAVLALRRLAGFP